MKKLLINEKLYDRGRCLKGRVERLDDLFLKYALDSAEYPRGYGARVLKVKAKCRNEMGIILGVML